MCVGIRLVLRARLIRLQLCDAGVPDKRIRLHAPPTAPANSGGNVLATQEKARPSGTDAVREEDHPGASGGERFTDFAASSGEASGFVRAVIGRIIPNEFFGSRGSLNKDCLMRTVDRFLKLRRFESLSLHEALQGLKVESARRQRDRILMSA